jgi:hypothetical protein
MGRTFKRNDRWKKDRRDKNFRKSKKFKDLNYGQHQHQSKPGDIPPIEEDYDGFDDNGDSQ